MTVENTEEMQSPLRNVDHSVNVSIRPTCHGSHQAVCHHNEYHSVAQYFND